MKLNRSEMAILAYVGALVLAGIASAVSAALLSGSLHAIDDSSRGAALLAVRLSQASAFVLIIAVIAGFGWLFPAIRRESNERGRLAKESQSFMHAALTDPLTGLQNRRYFDDALAEYMREFSSIGRPIGVVILDLDHFKTINDTYGHDNGDVVLRSVALSLRQHTRHHDVLARIGGEEFAIVFPNTDERALAALAERIRKAIQELPMVLEGKHVPITTSIGAVLWDGEESGQDLLKRADRLLYEAKANGRNRVITGKDIPSRHAAGAPRKPIFGNG